MIRVARPGWRHPGSWRPCGCGTRGARSPVARLRRIGATPTTWSTGPMAGRRTSPTWRCCADDITPSPTETTSSVMSTPPAVLSTGLLSPGTSSPEVTTTVATDPHFTVTCHRATHPHGTHPHPRTAHHPVTASGTTLPPMRSPGRISGLTRTQRARPARRSPLPGAVTGPTPSPGPTCGQTQATTATESPRMRRTDTAPIPKQTRGTTQAARPRDRAAHEPGDGGQAPRWCVGVSTSGELRHHTRDSTHLMAMLAGGCA